MRRNKHFPTVLTIICHISSVVVLEKLLEVRHSTPATEIAGEIMKRFDLLL